MKPSLGLDIGSHTIKLIELVGGGGKFSLVAAGSMPTPPGLGSSAEADLQAVANAVKRLVHDTGAKSKTVHIALPESKIFTRVIEVPALSDRELASAIKYEAEQYVPLPLDQVNVDFAVLRDAKATGTGKMEVLLVAAPKTLVEKYLSILELSGLEPVSAETEIIATSRAVAASVANIRNVLVISLGAQTTDLSILRGGILTFTRSIPAGGEALTRALAQGLDFNMSQAEEFKKTYGLQEDQLEGKIVAAVRPITDTIIVEVKRALAYYQEKYREEHVQSVILTGGTARLPGMVVYFAQTIGIEAQLANPWAGIAREARFNVLTAEGPTFCIAVGLALAGS